MYLHRLSCIHDVLQCVCVYVSASAVASKGLPLDFENREIMSNYFMMDWTKPVSKILSKLLPKSSQGTVCSEGTCSHL